MTRALTFLAVCVALVVASCGHATSLRFTEPGASMEPTIKMGATFSATAVDDYKGHRGDIVVFNDPGGWLGPGESGRIVKRVIGIGGDTVACCDASGHLELNGKALDEPYLRPGPECAGPMQQDGGMFAGGCKGWSAKVRAGRLFVMGDNRANAADSSFHLCNPTDEQRAASDMSTNGRKVAAKCLKAFVPESAVIAVVPA